MNLLAHQGGWDEVLMVMGPLALIGGLLWLANRRVSDQLKAQRQAVDGSDAPSIGSSDPLATDHGGTADQDPE